MAEISQKIAALKKKISARENKREKLVIRISVLKHNCKIVSKELSALNDEIQKLELEQLSENLKKNGITANDVAAAIADGIIKKNVSKAENVASGEEKLGTEREETVNETSGS